MRTVAAVSLIRNFLKIRLVTRISAMSKTVLAMKMIGTMEKLLKMVATI